MSFSAKSFYALCSCHVHSATANRSIRKDNRIRLKIGELYHIRASTRICSYHLLSILSVSLNQVMFLSGRQRVTLLKSKEETYSRENKTNKREEKQIVICT